MNLSVEKLKNIFINMANAIDPTILNPYYMSGRRNAAVANVQDSRVDVKKLTIASYYLYATPRKDGQYDVELHTQGKGITPQLFGSFYPGTAPKIRDTAFVTDILVTDKQTAHQMVRQFNGGMPLHYFLENLENKSPLATALISSEEKLGIHSEKTQKQSSIKPTTEPV